MFEMISHVQCPKKKLSISRSTTEQSFITVTKIQVSFLFDCRFEKFLYSSIREFFFSYWSNLRALCQVFRFSLCRSVFSIVYVIFPIRFGWVRFYFYSCRHRKDIKLIANQIKTKTNRHFFPL